MKFKLLGLCLLSLSLTSCVNTSKNETSSIVESKDDTKKSIVESHLNYDETKELVINPGDGFYSTYPIKLTENGVVNNITWFNEPNTYHIRCGLEAYSSKMGGKDIEIGSKALKSLDEFLTKLDNQGAGVIIRFAYDGFVGFEDKEPDLSLISKHIKSLGPIVSNHKSIIALECGLIGPWGEMHSSKLANQDTWNVILDDWLKSTKDIPILARRPKFIYTYMGYNLDNLDSFKYSNDEYKRLGVFNDGYLGTSTDTGTFEDREKEVKWMNDFLTTPYGGEVITPSSELTKLPKSIIDEQFKTGLSYLNNEWNDQIIDRWKKATIDWIDGYNGFNLYNYMNNHMGYGFLVQGFDCYEKDNKSYISLDIFKKGFKKYNNDFNIEISLYDKLDNLAYKKDFVLNNLSDTYEIDLNNLSNEYNLYLKIYNDKQNYRILNNTFDNQKDSNYIAKIIA